MRMPIDRSPVPKAKLFCDSLRTCPVNEFSLDHVATLMATDTAVPAMPSEGYGPFLGDLHSHNLWGPSVDRTKVFSFLGVAGMPSVRSPSSKDFAGAVTTMQSPRGHEFRDGLPTKVPTIRKTPASEIDRKSLGMSGEPGRTRTSNPLIKRPSNEN